MSTAGAAPGPGSPSTALGGSAAGGGSAGTGRRNGLPAPGGERGPRATTHRTVSSISSSTERSQRLPGSRSNRARAGGGEEPPPSSPFSAGCSPGPCVQPHRAAAESRAPRAPTLSVRGCTQHSPRPPAVASVHLPVLGEGPLCKAMTQGCSCAQTRLKVMDAIPGMLSIPSE